MIVLDTHVWVWWVHGDEALPPGAMVTRGPSNVADTTWLTAAGDHAGHSADFVMLMHRRPGTR